MWCQYKIEKSDGDAWYHIRTTMKLKCEAMQMHIQTHVEKITEAYFGDKIRWGFMVESNDCQNSIFGWDWCSHDDFQTDFSLLNFVRQNGDHAPLREKARNGAFIGSLETFVMHDIWILSAFFFCCSYYFQLIAYHNCRQRRKEEKNCTNQLNNFCVCCSVHVS